MFWEVAKRFDQSISDSKSEVKSISLVSSAENDSEIKQFFNSEVSETFLGIESVKNLYSCNCNLNQKRIENQNDFVMCSKVLERFCDLKVGLENLPNLTKPNDHLWINCTSGNYSHGFTKYYSAGYAPQITLKLSSHLKLKTFSRISNWPMVTILFSPHNLISANPRDMSAYLRNSNLQLLYFTIFLENFSDGKL